TWADYFKNYQAPDWHNGSVSAMFEHTADMVHKKTGYKFKNPRILASAFNHPSNGIRINGVPDYERLEFLGDCLHDQACIQYIYYKYIDKDPHWLTEHKMPMVSNRYMAY